MPRYTPTENTLHLYNNQNTEVIQIADYRGVRVVDTGYVAAMLQIHPCDNHQPYSIIKIVDGFLNVCKNCKQINTYAIDTQ